MSNANEPRTTEQLLVAELRAWACELYAGTPSEKETLKGAADAIERLTAECEKWFAVSQGLRKELEDCQESYQDALRAIR